MILQPHELGKLVARTRHFPHDFTVTEQEVIGLLDTIAEKDTQIEQLKAQVEKSREAFKQIQHDIDGVECRDDLDGIKGYIDEVLEAIEKNSTT